MSYEPSHRKPPRQERWPNATPGEAWPAYQQGDGGRTREPAAALTGSRNWYGTTSNGYGDAWGGARYDDPDRGYRTGGSGYGGTTTAHPTAGEGYVGEGYGDGFDGAVDEYADGTAGGYGETRGYSATPDDYDVWDSYSQPGHEFTGPASYPEQDEYPAPDPGASSVLVAPDTVGEWWRRDRGDGRGRDQASRGPVVGAVTGLLAAAVAIGVATFAAAFVRPQASPVSAMGAVLIDRIPATLRSHLTAHLGAHGQAVLLLGAIGLVAMVFGCAARRNVSLGVAGIAAFGLLGAFVAVTRPESRASDVVPWAIGGLAGIVALLWLARASAPTPQVASSRPAYGGRRRAR